LADIFKKPESSNELIELILKEMKKDSIEVTSLAELLKKDEDSLIVLNGNDKNRLTIEAIVKIFPD